MIVSNNIPKISIKVSSEGLFFIIIGGFGVVKKIYSKRDHAARMAGFVCQNIGDRKIVLMLSTNFYKQFSMIGLILASFIGNKFREQIWGCIFLHYECLSFRVQSYLFGFKNLSKILIINFSKLFLKNLNRCYFWLAK